MASSATLSAVSGDFSDGLSTRELPLARMGPIFQAAISSGKFHGTMAPTTPSGSRVISASASRAVGATWSYTLSIASAYHWMQRAAPGMSIFRLSAMGLPMSSVSSSASSSACSRIVAANRSSTFLRLAGARFAHTPLRKAARAEVTARSMSSWSPAATRARSLPVAGLMQSNVAPEAASR